MGHERNPWGSWCMPLLASAVNAPNVAEKGNETPRLGLRSDQVALLAFVAAEAVALALLLLFANHRWFWLDEWEFLARRDAGDIGDLLRPHNEHLSVLPILVYRGLWRLVGLRAYLPYQLLIILLHLTAVALLRAVMRRADVGAWVATAAASLFLLFGAGSRNILWAFQIGFVGALVLGLVHLLLSDHDGPIDRRDWLGLLAGVAGLLASSVAVTMVAVVGLAVLARRGWRVAVFHVAPLAGIFAAWWFLIARDDYTGPGIDVAIGPVMRFVGIGVVAAFDAIGQLPGVGVVLGVLVAVGLRVAWGRLDIMDLRRRAAAPAALLVGAIVFLVITGLGRATSAAGPESARASRYVHLVVAMVLPAVAVAADAVARRWRQLAPIVLVLAVIGVPGNVRLLIREHRVDASYHQRNRVRMLSWARLPAAKEVPRWVRPEPGYKEAPAVTIGWLLDGVDSGRMPDPGPLGPAQQTAMTDHLHLVLLQQNILRACLEARQAHGGSPSERRSSNACGALVKRP